MTDVVQIDALTEEQVAQLHALYQSEWWTQGRSLEDVRTVLANSSLIVAFAEPESGRLVAFCRLLTDFVFRAVLFDVIVAGDQRGRGLGRRLLDAVVAHPRLQQVGTLWLCCRSGMRPLYEKWGFEPFSDDIAWMQRANRDRSGDAADPAQP